MKVNKCTIKKSMLGVVFGKYHKSRISSSNRIKWNKIHSVKLWIIKWTEIGTLSNWSLKMNMCKE